MKISWEISESDIMRVSDFVKSFNNPLIQIRIDRNLNRKNILINNDSVIKVMLISLMTSQQHSDIDKRVVNFFSKKIYPLTYSLIAKEDNIQELLRGFFEEFGLTQYMRKIPGYFSKNFKYLERTKWDLVLELNHFLEKEPSKKSERILADKIDQVFKGLGSKQARVFLQTLGLSQFEIPVDEDTLAWFKNLGLPHSFSSTALQDKAFYHMISDGIQLLCEKSEIYPCVLEAAIFSEGTNIQWNRDNVLY